jgi:hypothetical protein
MLTWCGQQRKQSIRNCLLAYLLNILYVLCSTHFMALNQGHFILCSLSAGIWSCNTHMQEQMS